MRGTTDSGLYVCMPVCVNVCICMYVCMHGACMHVYVCVCACLPACLHVCLIYVCVCACLPACLSARLSDIRMYACTYVQYVLLCTSTHIHIYFSLAHHGSVLYIGRSRQYFERGKSCTGQCTVRASPRRCPAAAPGMNPVSRSVSGRLWIAQRSSSSGFCCPRPHFCSTLLSSK